MGAGGSCCSGARDDERMVTKLDLSHCGWTEVPPMVYQVERYIETLNLSHNRILTLPPQLFHCQELKHINLIDNGLDSLPPAIGSLPHLVSLKLDKNCIKDLPENLKNCRKLKRLSLSNNHIQQLPNIATQLINLEELFLNDCDLTFLPASVGRLTKLKILELRNNRLGNLPLSMTRLTSLTRLDLGDNSLQTLPECTSSMVSLQELLLDNNDLETMSGAGLKKLEHLDVSYNNLRNIGKDIGQCTALTLLNLGWNYLETLPETIANLTHLEIMILEMNEVTSLPRAIGKLSSLEEINLANNRLCDLPPTIGLIRTLVVLNISRNYVQELPCEIGSCLRLSIINASYNRLQSLPAEVGYLNNLKVLDVVGNFLMYLPISMSNLTGLRAIWLSANQNVPLIPFTEEISVASGERFLTNIALPQLGETALPLPEKEPVVEKTAWRRKIRFEEDDDILPGRLDRTPTPFPKELRCPARKQQRQDDNYVNVMDGKVAIFQQATQQPPTMLSFSDSSVTMIKEANIRRRHPNKPGVDEATETEAYPSEKQEPIYEQRSHLSTTNEAETEQSASENDRNYNPEGEQENTLERFQENVVAESEQYSNERPMDLSIEKDDKIQSNAQSNAEPIYISKRLQNGRMSPINEEVSAKGAGFRNEGSNEEHPEPHERCEPEQQGGIERTNESHDRVDMADTRKEVPDDNAHRDFRWKSEGANGEVASSERSGVVEGSSGYENTLWNRAKPCNGSHNGERLEEGDYGQHWSGGGNVKEGCYPVSAGSSRNMMEGAGEGAQRFHPQSGRYEKGNGEGPLRLQDGSVSWRQQSDVNISAMTSHNDRCLDQIDVESVDSFESERLRGSIVEPMELNRNQVIYSNLKNGNMFPPESRTYQNSGYMTPPYHPYTNREDVSYSSIPHQIERIYGQGTPNDFRPKALPVRQSPYGTVRQSPFQDNRNIATTFRPESHPNTPVQFLLRQSPYGTIRQSPQMDNGNTGGCERASSRQEQMIMDRSRIHSALPTSRQSPCAVRQSPHMENGNMDLERPPSKQEMLNIAERNRRENIPPPCYEIAKMYSTKAALFENKHHAGQN